MDFLTTVDRNKIPYLAIVTGTLSKRGKVDGGKQGKCFFSRVGKGDLMTEVWSILSIEFTVC